MQIALWWVVHYQINIKDHTTWKESLWRYICTHVSVKKLVNCWIRSLNLGEIIYLLKLLTERQTLTWFSICEKKIRYRCHEDSPLAPQSWLLHLSQQDFNIFGEIYLCNYWLNVKCLFLYSRILVLMCVLKNTDVFVKRY